MSDRTTEDMPNQGIFRQFPKVRPPMPKALEKIYAKHYKSNREGRTFAASLAQKMESWLHRKVAADVVGHDHLRISTLELGAGTLNQLPYEPANHCYDIVEPFAEFYKQSPLLQRIRTIYKDIADVPSQNRYDRITSIAAFEHICNLPEVVSRSGLLLNETGVLRVAIPSEGTWLWILGWKLTTGLEFKLHYGLDYGLLIDYEHVNTAKEIEEIVEYFFKDVRCKALGLSKEISFYRYYECHKPNVERCEGYLNLKVN